MKIRVAKKKDIKELIKLLFYLFNQEKEFSFNKPLHIKALKRIITDSSVGKVFVVIKKEKIVAMTNLLFSVSTYKGSTVAILEDMVVLPKYRNSGIGSKLLNYILKFVEDNRIKRVTLLSDYDNYKAHKFYKKFNFKKSKMIVLRR